jgi:hypothetical protein
MSFSVGIVGLPNVGKSTLFKALTRNPVDIADYPFTTISPNVGVVQVPDERLKEIAKVIKPEKVTPTVIEFVDIAGLVKNAHKGEGLGNQFLAQIRECDAIVMVIKGFGDNINPEEEIDTIKTEFEMKDEESKEDENLLSKKPVIYLLNTSNGEVPGLKENFLTINLKDEAEMTDLSEKEREELNLKSKLDQLIITCYNILDLITFYTITGGKETRAWTLKRGETAPKAGGVVHSDFQEKFIKAEVIGWQKLTETGSWKEAREKGWIQLVGKDYIVQDGDVIEFKI